MRSLSIIPLLAVAAFAQPDCGKYKVASFTDVDSVNITGIVGSFSGGGLGFMRINADENGCEFVVPTGTDLPVNQRDPALLGHATADTMTINVANITVLNTDSTVNNISQTTDTATINDRLRLDYATANRPLQTDASKNVVTGSYTGTGTTEVLSVGPTISNLTATGETNVGQTFIGGGGSGWVENSNGPVIFRTTDAGGNYPFNGAGHLGVQPRTSSGRDIVFATGTGVPTWRLAIQSSGNIVSPNFFGSGTRLVTATSSGILGNATSIAPAYTWAGAQTLQSTLAVTGNVSVNAGKFQVKASTGNVTSGAKTLLVSGSSPSTTSLRLLSGITNTSGLATVGDSLSPFIASSGGGSHPFNSFGALVLSGRYQKTQSSRIVMMTGQEIRAVMDSGGFLGLGTENPSERLHVVGGGRVTGLFSTTEQKINPVIMTPGINGENKAIRINFYGNGDQDVSAPIWFGRDGSSSGAGIAAYQATADNDRVGLIFFTHNSATSTDPSTEAARFSSNGNFWIGGTTNLGNDYRLQVTGTAYATRFQSGTGTSAFDTITANVLDIGTITGGGLFDSMEVDGPFYLPDLTANRPLYLDGDNKIATGTWSGTGTVIPTTQGATMNNLTATGTFTTPTAITMGSNTFTRSGAHALTLTTGAATNVTLPASGTLYSTATGSITSAQLAASLTNETGSGAAVFGTSPTIAAPTLTGTTTVQGNLSMGGELSGPGATGINARPVLRDGGRATAIRANARYGYGGFTRVAGLHASATQYASASIDTAVGVLVDSIDAATHRFAFLSRGDAPSHFGGRVYSSDSIVAENGMRSNYFDIEGQGYITPYYVGSIEFGIANSKFTGNVNVEGALTTQGVARLKGVSSGIVVLSTGGVTTTHNVTADDRYIISDTQGDHIVILPLSTATPVGREVIVGTSGWSTTGGGGTVNVGVAPTGCMIYDSDSNPTFLLDPTASLDPANAMSATFVNDGSCWRVVQITKPL